MINDITVIIVSYKSKKTIFNCIKSIERFNKILIFDNSNDKELKREIGAFEIKTKQLNWALAEGFTHRQMIDQLDVFEMVPIYKVAERLSFSKPS